MFLLSVYLFVALLIFVKLVSLMDKIAEEKGIDKYPFPLFIALMTSLFWIVVIPAITIDILRKG